MSTSTQASQRGWRDWQSVRPCAIRRWLKAIHSGFGMTRIRSCSARTASKCRVRPSRRAMRPTWVSTTTPSARPNAQPSTTLAVLRPTPGKRMSSASVCGTFPACCSTSALQQPRIFFALARKNPVLWITASISSVLLAAMAAGVGQRSNRWPVTMLTRLSVH